MEHAEYKETQKEKDPETWSPQKQTITKRRPRRETCIYYTGKGAVRQQFLPVLRQIQRHSGKETRVRGLFCAKCDQFTGSQHSFPQRCGKSCWETAAFSLQDPLSGIAFSFSCPPAFTEVFHRVVENHVEKPFAFHSKMFWKIQSLAGSERQKKNAPRNGERWCGWSDSNTHGWIH